MQWVSTVCSVSWSSHRGTAQGLFQGATTETHCTSRRQGFLSPPLFRGLPLNSYSLYFVVLLHLLSPYTVTLIIVVIVGGREGEKVLQNECPGTRIISALYECSYRHRMTPQAGGEHISVCTCVLFVVLLVSVCFLVGFRFHLFYIFRLWLSCTTLWATWQNMYVCMYVCVCGLTVDYIPPSWHFCDFPPPYLPPFTCAVCEPIHLSLPHHFQFQEACKSFKYDIWFLLRVRTDILCIFQVEMVGTHLSQQVYALINYIQVYLWCT